MNTLNGFKHYQTENQIDLYICKNPKYKTNLVQFYFLQSLSQETVSKTAPIPFILYRGSKKYPTSRDFKIRLDELYGAELTVSVMKRGEVQILSFSLEIVNEEFIVQQEPLFYRGLELLYELIANPLFLEKYVEQEKEYLVREIQSLINDKYSYSIERCYQEMCQDEPYGLFKLGKIDEIKKLDREIVYNRYLEVLNENKIIAFAIGDIEEEETYRKFNEIFTFKHTSSEDYNQTIVKEDIQDTREVIEEMNVQQGKLVLGFRTGITRKSKLYYPLLVYNGTLGAFPHSKLFQNVRERANLAYYASSNIESTKGIMIITAGIDFVNYEKAKNIIIEQIKLLKEGQFTEEEFIWTRKALTNSFKNTADNIKGLAGHYLLGLLNGIEETIDESLENINTVTREEVVDVASKIKLDTIYFLNKNKKVE
jgi:predicted Zn-dependent peptidase